MFGRPVSLARCLGLLLLLVWARTLPLAAQRVPNVGCPPAGCITGVSVTPDGGSLSLPPSTGGTASFFAKNTGNVSTTFTFTCIATSLTCGTVTPTSATISPGVSREVDVQFTSGTVNGKVTMKATNGGTATDQGFFNVTIVNVGPPTAVVLRNQNGDNIVRSACLTSGAGEAAAWECGDLVVTHAMPAYTSMNKARSLTLLYSSGQALPQPVVAVAVTENSSLTLPTSVRAELKINGAPAE